MYRYIALADIQRAQALDSGTPCPPDEVALRHVQTGSGHLLYATPETPILRLTPWTTVMGHLFWHASNAAVTDVRRFDGLSSERLFDVLIQECWGEYVVIELSPSGPLTVMRDPSGGVGCVYATDGSFLTSDISLPVMAGVHRRAVDWRAIEDMLAYPHLKMGGTGLVGVRELLPGRKLELSPGSISTAETWSPWHFVATELRHVDPREAAIEVRHAVASTVKTWAETDRSLLLELSGGLDSSIVAASLLDADARVSCCNLVTPVPGADERHYAWQMAELLGCELHVATLPLDDVEFDFAPPPHTVSPSTWFLQHVSNEAKESIGRQVGAGSYFSGGGGDTVFCHTSAATPAADALKVRGPRAAMRAIHNLAELHQCTVWKAGRLAVRKLRNAPKPPRQPQHSFLTAVPDRDPSSLHPWFVAPCEALPGDRERIFDLAGNQVFRDGAARGRQWPLRMPLLSQPVVEACLRVPTWMWIAGGRNRAVARDAFADRLPPDILHRRSKGTFMNYSGAVFRRHRQRLRDYLLQGELTDRGLLDADALRSFFQQDPDHHGESFMRIFDLCEVENWVRHQD